MGEDESLKLDRLQGMISVKAQKRIEAEGGTSDGKIQRGRGGL